MKSIKKEEIPVKAGLTTGAFLELWRSIRDSGKRIVGAIFNDRKSVLVVEPIPAEKQGE
jgi:hypothetical protein